MLEPFINRLEELAMLERLYKKAKTQAQFLVLYGKRRVGKTELVKRFFKDKPHLYYLASRIAASDQIKTISGVISDHFAENYLKTSGFANWRDLFSYLSGKLKGIKEPLILVFDEFPYLVESDRGMSSYFQYGWDEHLKDKRVLLILLGSSISMMYEHTLSSRAPLYGRRTASWKLEPFLFAQAKKFYRLDNFEKLFSFYGLSGGMPAYLKEFTEEKTVWDNIKEKVLTKGSLLYLEPELLIAEELKEPRTYLTILKAIGFGRTKFAEILNQSGLKANVASKYLSTLVKLRLVKKEVPVTEKHPEKSKKGIYLLSDNFLRFYYSFILPNLSALESGRKKFVLDKIKKSFPYFMAKTYEESSGEFAQQLWKKEIVPFFPRIGRWWDKRTEIDLIGLNAEENSILFVETKWNNQPLELDIIHSLKQKAKNVTFGENGRKEYFAIVAKGGFSQHLKEVARKEKVFLIKEDRLIC